MQSDPWLIYGAYGFTGELVAREAIARGLRPVLGGRRPEALRRLAAELDLPACVFDLRDPRATRRAIADLEALLHCAGPFVHTSGPMVDACLATGTHYLDITGEIGVFESIFARHRQARDAGVILLPGVGFDVVPTDCLARRLADELPDATHLELALHTAGARLSPGTLKTMIEALPAAGAERIDGVLVPRPLAFASREIDFSCGRRSAITIAWGDLSTAFRSTGIPNIRVWASTSPRRIRRLRRLRGLLPLVGAKPVKRALQWWITESVTGPSAGERRKGTSYFWGEVRNAAGEIRSATLETPEGYTLTANAAVECLVRVLAGTVEPGARTPAGAFGHEFVYDLPGVSAAR